MLEVSRVEGGKVAETRTLPVWETGGDLTQSAIVDLTRAFRQWHLWGRLSWQDVALRYRRSTLGPFWLTLSMGVMVGALGLVYGTILQADMQRYLPFLTIGFLFWTFISVSVSEGCQAFIEADWIIRQIDLPLSMFPLRVVWRNIIILLHNAVVFLLVLLFFPLELSWTTMLAIPGMVVLAANALWCAVLFGMLGARFRDFPQVVASLMQVAFFVTPIIWMPNLAAGRGLIVSLNPFYHFLEIVRGPLLGQAPTALNWGVTLGITAVGWIVAMLFYRRFHGRIAYWV